MYNIKRIYFVHLLLPFLFSFREVPEIEYIQTNEKYIDSSLKVIDVDDVVLDYIPCILFEANNPKLPYNIDITITQYPPSTEYCEITASSGQISSSTLIPSQESRFRYNFPHIEKEMFPDSIFIKIVFCDKNAKTISTAKLIYSLSENNGKCSYVGGVISTQSPRNVKKTTYSPVFGEQLDIHFLNNFPQSH